MLLTSKAIVILSSLMAGVSWSGNAGAAGEELCHCGWSNLLMIVLREYCNCSVMKVEIVGDLAARPFL